MSFNFSANSPASLRKNSVNPSFGKRYVNICSRVERFEQARLQRTLIREYKDCRRRPCQSYFSALSAVKYLVICNKIRATCPVFDPEAQTRREQPVVSSVEPCRRNPRNPRINITYLKKQTQFYAFLGPKTAISPKTKPIQTQTKPICKTAKMNVYPLLTKRYEKKRLFDRNENKPKIYHGEAQRRRTNPIFCLLSSVF